MVVRRAIGLEPRPLTTPIERLKAQALGFTFLTVPVASYFACMDSSARGGTLGKQALGLCVGTTDGGAVPLGRSLVWAGVKFAPWELAHTAPWQMPGAFTEDAKPGATHYAGFGLSLQLSVGYLSALFRGTNRTLYDRIAGTRVMSVR